MNWTQLQAAVLQILLKAKRPVTLDDLEVQAYDKAGKKKPKTAHQAMAACVRTINTRIRPLNAEIKYPSMVGRGHKAFYTIKGRTDLVKLTLETQN